MKSRIDAAGEATSVEKADIAVVTAAADRKQHPVGQVLGAIGPVGDQPPMLALSAATLVAGWWFGERRLVRAGARMAAAELVTIVLKDLVKRSVTRTRPHVLIDEGRYERRPFGPRASKYSSFPSGHTAGAVAVSRAFAREYPEAKLPAYGFAAAIALGQLPNAAHYPTDVGVGAVIGAISEVVVDRAVRAIDQRSEI